MTLKVKEVIRKDKGTINIKKTIMDALIEMTRTGLGAVTLVDGKSNIVGMFTDGDLRRQLEANGEGVLKKHLSELSSRKPLTIDGNESLYACSKIFGEKKVDNIVVVENGLPVGILDIQDLMV
jgi:CBS domain-containing protein